VNLVGITLLRRNNVSLNLLDLSLHFMNVGLNVVQLVICKESASELRNQGREAAEAEE